MILVVSHAGDGHLPAVTAKLDEAGADWVLLDTDLYPEPIRIDDGPAGCCLRMDGREIRLRDVRAVWWRRPRPPVITGRSPEVTRWAQRQAFAALDSALGAVSALWVNHPRHNRQAEDKPANLRRAAALGLDVPDWRVTNDPVVAAAFAAGHETIIVKPVEAAYVTPTRSLWTRRLGDSGPLDHIGPEPYLLQQFIDKTEDVRVTVVGTTVFAVAIDSQATTETSVDMRAGDLAALDHQPIELPPRVASALLLLCADLQLQFAAIDLVRDQDGALWFLEVNPNGQWAWLEQLADVPIAGALTRLLMT
ncbi:hypothetical protein NBH00_18745 [Paraconexibacter antarcticus]|uniref:ATP-grasp domain-containing protein n=1 Tax=Paraconexibacter antarcticus TaxID=2949664 RepID=A0ABY5DRD7_9ACTN|nr:hypothetical protein [Paraconexibacter antarcticus]UTI63377.1 hypothetical protein NBH00_18745 [Paraconexibacter antarcticus]